jgi:hypothetical protein
MCARRQAQLQAPPRLGAAAGVGMPPPAGSLGQLAASGQPAPGAAGCLMPSGGGGGFGRRYPQSGQAA